MAVSIPERGVCSGEFSSRSTFSASGNAAMMAGMRFLVWGMEIDGQVMNLISAISRLPQECRDKLGEDVLALLEDIALCNARDSKTHEKVGIRNQHRILLFPLGTGHTPNDYVALTPLSAFSMVGEIEARIRSVRSRGKFYSQRFMALGSGHAQNLGLLFVDASGEFARLLNSPPPPPKNDLSRAIKRDAVGIRARFLSKTAVLEFLKAANAEIANPIAEAQARTNAIFKNLVIASMQDLETAMGMAETNDEGEIVGLGKKDTALANAWMDRRGKEFDEFANQVTSAVFERITKASTKSKPIIGSDGQYRRFKEVTIETLKEMV
jgi:hypothetical protein